MTRTIRATTAAILLTAVATAAACAPPAGGGGDLGPASNCLNGGTYGPLGTASGYPYNIVAYGILNTSTVCIETEVTLRIFRVTSAGDQLLRTQTFNLPLGGGTQNLVTTVDVTPYVTSANNNAGNPARFYGTYTIRSNRYTDFTGTFATVNRYCQNMPAGC